MVKIRYNVLQIEIFKTSLKLYWKSSDPRVLNECTQPCFVQLAFKQTLFKIICIKLFITSVTRVLLKPLNLTMPLHITVDADEKEEISTF